MMKRLRKYLYQDGDYMADYYGTTHWGEREASNKWDDCQVGEVN